jgi:hypothetical protein
MSAPLSAILISFQELWVVGFKSKQSGKVEE